MDPLKFILSHAIARQRAIDAVREAPEGYEVVVREQTKARGLDQNAAMWSGPLADIAEQAWIDGRRFSDEVWHEYFKRTHLPEDDDPELADLVKNPETYRKWDYTPSGDRICIGSTTQLTRKGFARYMLKLEADGANMGVRFHVAPRKAA